MIFAVMFLVFFSLLIFQLVRQRRRKEMGRVDQLEKVPGALKDGFLPVLKIVIVGSVLIWGSVFIAIYFAG